MSRASDSKPHILLITSDQQRYDSLGCYGNAGVATPTLDALAERGVRFSACYANGVICTPSRASLMTGKPLTGHGVYRLHDVLPDEEVLFPARLRAAGYRTGHFGKLHVSGRVEEYRRRHPKDGFDHYEYSLDPAGIAFDSSMNAYARWLEERDPDFYDRVLDEGKQLEHFPEDLHFSRWLADRTIAYIRRQAEDPEVRSGGTPLFLNLGFYDPHDPYLDYPEQARRYVDPAKLPEPTPMPKPAEYGQDGPTAVRKEQEARGSHYMGRPIGAELMQELRIGYFASIAFMDDEIGRVLRSLEETGLAEDTIVIFLSDHGDMLGDRGLFQKGAFFYEPSVRVPLIIAPAAGRHAALPPGTVHEGLVQPNDLASTVLALAGVPRQEIETYMPESRDPLPAVAERDAERDLAVSEYRNSGYGFGGGYFDPPIHATMVHDGRYKLVLYHEDDEGELFDLEEDPRESDNLYDHPHYQATVLRLTRRAFDVAVRRDETYHGSRGGDAAPWNSTRGPI